MNFIFAKFCRALLYIAQPLRQYNYRSALRPNKGEMPGIELNEHPSPLNCFKGCSCMFRYASTLVALVMLTPTQNALGAIVYSSPAQGYAYNIYLFSGIRSLGSFVCSANGWSYVGATGIGGSNYNHPSYNVTCQGINPDTGMPINVPGGTFHWSLNCELGPGWLQDFQHPEICFADKTDPVPGKNAGTPDSCSAVGNPINSGTANKYQREIDYVASSVFPLEFVRFYNTNLTSTPQQYTVPGPQLYDWIRTTYWNWVRQDSAPR